MNLRILEGQQALEKYESLKEKGLIIFEGIVGSQAYGTALPTSDIDKKFVYIESLENVLTNNVTHQINLVKDYVGYELGRFIELLNKCSPNMLDLLHLSDECIIHCDPLYRKYFITQREKFLTQKARKSFGDYAHQQILKAKGKNKKFMNPQPDVRKGLSDFIWVVDKQGSVLLKDYLKEKNLQFNKCGLSAIDHMKDYYNVFLCEEDQEFYNVYLKKIEEIKKMPWYKKIFFTESQRIELATRVLQNNQELVQYSGITNGEQDDNFILSSFIPKEVEPFCQCYINISGFQTHCREYSEYHKWVAERNIEKYNQNIENGGGYDSKNMLHCHRLLDMAIEILKDKELNIRRKNIEQLLNIRAGEYSYEQLIFDAQEKQETIKSIESDLPLELDENFLNKTHLEIRTEFYS